MRSGERAAFVVLLAVTLRAARFVVQLSVPDSSRMIGRKWTSGGLEGHTPSIMACRPGCQRGGFQTQAALSETVSGSVAYSCYLADVSCPQTTKPRANPTFLVAHTPPPVFPSSRPVSCRAMLRMRCRTRMVPIAATTLTTLLLLASFGPALALAPPW